MYTFVSMVRSLHRKGEVNSNMNKKETIVLVDDDPTVRELSILVLERKGYDVLYFSTGADALATIIAACPDLIITDFHMPGMTGGELLHAVHKGLNGNTPPAIIVSALPHEAQATLNELPHIVREIVSKPFDPNDFTAAVQRALLLPAQ